MWYNSYWKIIDLLASEEFNLFNFQIVEMKEICIPLQLRNNF